jgi:phenylpyruvate tautomerase PptA (4-oxalocrotonate tautomerase family)
MPLLKLQTSVAVAGEQKKRLLAELSKTLAQVTGKPENYVMVALEAGDLLMAGTAGPAAFVDIRGIGGLTKPVNAKLAKVVGDLLKKELGIEPERTYLNFSDVAAHNWGWNGATFG